MKKYIYQLLCSLFIGATMVACAEDYMETDKGHDTLTLSVNQQELVLNEKNIVRRRWRFHGLPERIMEAVTVSLIRWNWRKPERTLRILIR